MALGSLRASAAAMAVIVVVASFVPIDVAALTPWVAVASMSYSHFQAGVSEGLDGRIYVMGGEG